MNMTESVNTNSSFQGSPTGGGQTIQTLYITLWKEDEILYVKWADGINITLDIAKQAVEARIKFSEGISYPCLIDIRGIKSASKEAREYLAKEGTQLIKAGALLTGSILTRVLANFFLAINKPPVHTKLFTDEAEAKEWLKQYL